MASVDIASREEEPVFMAGFFAQAERESAKRARSMASVEDSQCIVGVATGTPDGGVAVIRVSGGSCAQLAASLADKLPPPRLASLRRLKDAQGRALDHALLLWMPGPDSFTGEDVLEIHCHAGEQNVRQVVRRCLELGARAARAGEFSRRAFERGKMSLDQAESLPLLLSAESELDLSRAQRLLRGELGDQVDEMVRKVFTLRIEIEAHLDFPEDLEGNPASRWLEVVNALSGELVSWVGRHRGQEERSGRCRVVIGGAPNAGKSSLFNALIGSRRSIVSDQAGTTRDFVESSLRWEGAALELVDTAGLREQAGVIEKEGIAMGQREIRESDLLLWLESGACPRLSDEALRELAPQGEILRITSKCDQGPTVEGQLQVSVEEGHEQLVDDLRDLIAQRILGWKEERAGDWLGLDRHAECVHRAIVDLAKVCSMLSGEEFALEIVAFHLSSAERALAEIRGVDELRPVGEELLHAIFSNFCIGK